MKTMPKRKTKKPKEKKLKTNKYDGNIRLLVFAPVYIIEDEIAV